MLKYIIDEPVHEMLVLIAFVQSRQTLRCSHTQIIEVEEDSDQHEHARIQKVLSDGANFDNVFC